MECGHYQGTLDYRSANGGTIQGLDAFGDGSNGIKVDHDHGSKWLHPHRGLGKLEEPWNISIKEQQVFASRSIYFSSDCCQIRVLIKVSAYADCQGLGTSISSDRSGSGDKQGGRDQVDL